MTTRKADWSWSSFILPQIDQTGVYTVLNQTRRSAARALADTNNDVIKALRTPISAFQCPSDAHEDAADRMVTAAGLPVPARAVGAVPHGLQDYNGVDKKEGFVSLTNYAANLGAGGSSSGSNQKFQMQFGAWLDGPFNANSGVTFDVILDGASNTIAIGERAWKYTTNTGTLIGGAARMYMTQADRSCAEGLSDALGIMGYGTNYPYADIVGVAGGPVAPGDTVMAEHQSKMGYSSAHPGGAQFVLCDGSVRFISDNTHCNPDRQVNSTLEALFCMNDGQVVGDF